MTYFNNLPKSEEKIIKRVLDFAAERVSTEEELIVLMSAFKNIGNVRIEQIVGCLKYAKIKLPDYRIKELWDKITVQKFTVASIIDTLVQTQYRNLRGCILPYFRENFDEFYSYDAFTKIVSHFFTVMYGHSVRVCKIKDKDGVQKLLHYNFVSDTNFEKVGMKMWKKGSRKGIVSLIPKFADEINVLLWDIQNYIGFEKDSGRIDTITYDRLSHELTSFWKASELFSEKLRLASKMSFSDPLLDTIIDSLWRGATENASDGALPVDRNVVGFLNCIYDPQLCTRRKPTPDDMRFGVIPYVLPKCISTICGRKDSFYHSIDILEYLHHVFSNTKSTSSVIEFFANALFSTSNNIQTKSSILRFRSFLAPGNLIRFFQCAFGSYFTHLSSVKLLDDFLADYAVPHSMCEFTKILAINVKNDELTNLTDVIHSDISHRSKISFVFFLDNSEESEQQINQEYLNIADPANIHDIQTPPNNNYSLDALTTDFMLHLIARHDCKKLLTE